MRIRRTLIWIAIPSISCLIAGIIFSFSCVTNFGVTILAVIMAACMIEAGIEKNAREAFAVAFWLLEILTGFLLKAIFIGMFGDMNTLVYILCLVGMAGLVLLNITYVKEMWKDVIKR